MEQENHIVFPEDIERTNQVKGKVAQMADEIRDRLKEAGLYKPQQEFQIEVCARDLLQYRMLSNASLELDSPYIVEKSREGHSRRTINPIFAQVDSASKRLAVDFEKLTMNVKDDKREEKPEEENRSSGIEELLKAMVSD